MPPLARFRVLLLGLAAALTPASAEAHLVGVEFGAFYAGALHLILGVEYLALLLAVALFAALQDRTRARWVLAALPVGLALGVLSAPWLPVGIAAVESQTIAAGLVIIAGLGAIALRLGAAPIATLAGAAGLVIGAANGIALQDAQGTDPWLYTAGTIAAGTVLITLVLAAASALVALADWMRLGARVACSWLATLGVLLIGLTLSGQ